MAAVGRRRYGIAAATSVISGCDSLKDWVRKC